jgi:hypothetical protein
MPAARNDERSDSYKNECREYRDVHRNLEPAIE